MSKPIFEEEGQAPAAGMATAQQKIEKQARQLAYDTRYQVKKEIGDKKVNPAAMKRFLLQRLQKSTAAPNVKVRAKQMLLGEDYIGDVADFAAETVANALFKVFVEETQEEVSEEIELQYLKELEETKERKYKVRVTDKKTGNSYVRYATREKITQLRTNPNIQSVEMTEYGEPREGERKSGEDTARATGGGNAKRDYDGDGTVESGAKEYRGAVHNAIQRKRGGVPDGKDTSSVKEEFLADAATEDSNDKKITGKGVNNYSGKNPTVKIMPEDPTSQTVRGPRSVYAHYEPEGEVIAETGYSKFLKKVQDLEEMSVSISQQQAAGAALSAKRGKTDPSTLKGASREMYDSMTEKQLRDFAKTKHEGLPTHKEAVEPSGGGKSPQLPSGVIKAVDELPQKIKTIFSGLGGAKVRPTQTTTIRKEEKECGCEEDSKSSKKGEMDVRELPTKMNMIKNKMRAMGLKMSYDPEGELIDERARARKGEPRPDPKSLSHRVIMDVRNRNKEGIMTRSGRTVAQHEADRGVKKEPGAPTPTGETTADRLAARKKRAAAAQASVERAREEESRRRRLA